MSKPALAVDFDGVIAGIGGYTGTDDFQGAPNKDVITAMRALKDKGWRIIIYTCRPATDGLLNWLKANGVPFDDINRNSEAPILSHGTWTALTTKTTAAAATISSISTRTRLQSSRC